MRARQPRPAARRRGAAIVEFAVVAPVLLTFILGVIEIGRLVMVAQVDTNAAREAARYAAQGGANTATVDAYVRTYLASAGINGTANGANGAVAVAIEYQNGAAWAATTDPSTLSPGTPIRVTVSIDFKQQSWLPAQFFTKADTQVQGVAIMRKE